MSFIISMPTVPKPRPRATVGGHIFMPTRYRVWMEEARFELARRWSGEPLEGPVSLSLVFRGPRRPAGDLEGLVGAWADAMSGYQALRTPIIVVDDKQIEELSARFEAATTWETEISVTRRSPVPWPAKTRRKPAACPRKVR